MASGRLHRAVGRAAVDHTERVVLARSGQIDLAHALLQVERRLVDVVRPLQVVAVVALARLRELTLGEREGNVQKERHVGTRQAVIAVLGLENPVFERAALLFRGEFGALERHVRVDVAVQHHRFARREPLPDPRGRIAPIAGEEQRHQIGVDRLDRPQLAAQEAGDQLAEDRARRNAGNGGSGTPSRAVRKAPATCGSGSISPLRPNLRVR